MATVIDSLLVELGIDDTKFKQGQKDAENSTKKWSDSASKANKQQIKETKDLADNFGKVKDSLLGLAAIAIGFNGLKDFISSMVTGNAALGRTSTMLNMSARDLDAWGGAVESVGGTAQGFQASLQNIQGGLQKFRMGMGGEEVVTGLARLGVQAKNGTVSMTELSAALVRVKDAQGAQAAMALGQQIGLDQSTFQMLIQGPAAVQALHDKYFALSGVTDENTKASQRLQAAWAQIKQGSSGIANSIFGVLTPALEWVAKQMNGLGDWVSTHKDFVAGFFIAAAAGATALTVALFPITGTVMALIAAVLAASVAVGALYADWKAWTEGGKSALGDLWNYYRDVIKLIVTLFTGSGKQISAAWSKVWTDCKTMFTDFVNWIKAAAPTIGDAIKKAFSAAFDWVKGRARAVWDAITGKESAGDTDSPESSSASSSPESASPESSSASSSPESASPAPPAGSAQAAGAPSRLPRGLRNNNPGNIRYGDFAKKYGATGQDDKGFAIFPTMQAGSSAMAGLLKSYASKGVDTIASIVARYAPSSENDTAAYIASVAKQTGINPNQHLSGDQYASVQRAMAIHENGSAYSRMVGAGASANAQSQGGGTTTVETNIQAINVHTQATDANGIARDMHKSLQDNALTHSGVYGMA